MNGCPLNGQVEDLFRILIDPTRSLSQVSASGCNLTGTLKDLSSLRQGSFRLGKHEFKKLAGKDCTMLMCCVLSKNMVESLCHYAILMIHPIGFIGSMYGIFTYIWLTCMAHVGKYATHGSYWYVKYNSDSMNLELSLVLMLCPESRVHIVFISSCPAQPGPSGSAPFMESARRRTHYHLSTSPTTAFNMLKIYHRRLRSCSLTMTAPWILHLESLQRRAVWFLRRERFLIGCTFLSWRHHMLQKDPERISASTVLFFSLPRQAPFSESPSHIFVQKVFFDTASTRKQVFWFWHGGNASLMQHSQIK